MSNVDKFIVVPRVVALDGTVNCGDCGQPVDATFAEMDWHDCSSNALRNAENGVILPSNCTSNPGTTGNFLTDQIKK